MKPMSTFPEGRVAFLVTSNIHKFMEARHVLAEFNIATAMLNIKAEEIQADDIEKIARASALDAVKKCNLPIIVEDAGLFIEALNGFPGPYSSYVHKTLGTQGILKLMKNISRRDAKFHSVVAFHSPKQKAPKCFHGEVKGEIVHQELGNSGFGFDPVFKPLGCEKTFAEMNINEKNKYSHRAKALRKFARWYKETFSK